MGGYETADVKRLPKYEARRRRKRSASKKKKRRRRRKSHVGASARYMKLAKPNRSTFLTFLRRYRQKHGDWTVTKVAVEGARKWCAMTKPQRRKYLSEISEEAQRKTKRDDRITEGRRRRKGKGGKSKKGKGGGRKRRRRKRYLSARGSGRKLAKRFSSASGLMDDLNPIEASNQEFGDFYI